MRKSLVLVGVIVLIGIGIFFYVQQQGKNTGPTKITYPVVEGTTSQVVAAVMKQYGIDTKHGLDVDFIITSPGDLEQQEFDGTIKGLLIMSPIQAMQTTLQGRPVKILAPLTYMTYYLAVRNDSPIKSLSDLKGKKVGLIPKSISGYAPIALILASAGLDPDTDFLTTYGSIPEMVNLLGKGQVDAAIVTYPTAAALFTSGQFRSLAQLGDLWQQNQGSKQPFIATVAFDDWYKDPAHQIIAQKFFDAFFETVALMNSNPSVVTDESNPKVSEILTKYNLSSEAAKKLLQENLTSFLPTAWNDQTVIEEQTLIKAAQEHGFLPAGSLPDIIVRPSTQTN